MAEDIFHANFDRYLELLRDPDLAGDKRATILRQLIAEEGRLNKFQEHLAFAESRATRGRELLDQARAKLNNSKHLTEHEQAVRLVSNLKSIQHLLDSFCRQVRSFGNSGLEA